MDVGALEAGERTLVVNDIIMIGETLNIEIMLLKRVRVKVVECVCVIELPKLKVRERLGDKTLFVLVN